MLRGQTGSRLKTRSRTRRGTRVQLQRSLSMSSLRSRRIQGRHGEVAGAVLEAGGNLDASGQVALRARRARRPWYVIDPRTSRWLAVWDVWTSIALIFTAVLTPYEVALLEPPLTWLEASNDGLFLLNRLIDVTFFTDMILQFMLMTQTYNDREGTKWVDEPAVIIQSYVRSWFTLDLMSLVPSIFDMVPLAASEADAAAGRWRPCGGWRCLIVSSGDDAPFLNRLKALRVIRVVRLIKLMRLLRASRMLRRWETHMSINYASLNLGFACSMYLVTAHWAACLLLLPTTFYDNPVETWLGSYGYCVSEPAAVTAAFESASGDSAQALAAADAFAATLDFVSPVNGTCSFGRGLHGQSDAALALLRDGSCSVRCAAHPDTYAASFFMALQIICGTSGGEFSSHAYDTFEHVLFAAVVFTGALVWGYLIGTFVSVLTNSNPDLTWFRTTFDQLNHFMHVNELPTEMRVRLREYFQQSRHIHRGQQRKQLMTLMSPALQGEVCMRMNERWLSSVKFLQSAESEFIVLVSSMLHPAVFAPGEVATFGYLYIIHKGVALYGGRVLTSGSVFGQDMILRRQTLCLYSARAMSYLEVYRISRVQLLELARPFPKAWSLIRWEAFRLALRRTLVHYMHTEHERERQGKEEAANLLENTEAVDGGKKEKSWTNFIDKATEPGQVSSLEASQGIVNPTNTAAVEDPITLQQVNNEVTKTQEEVWRVSATVTELKHLIQGTSGQNASFKATFGMRAAREGRFTADAQLPTGSRDRQPGRAPGRDAVLGRDDHTRFLGNGVNPTGEAATLVEASMLPGEDAQVASWLPFSLGSSSLSKSSAESSSAAVATAVSAELKPLLQRLVEDQRQQRQEAARQRSEMAALAKDVATIRSWMVNGVLAKLSA